ncbi:MAG: hypothetical protein IJ632_03375 [Muribaculaceae bacterium]|nr:hypothetical protein [Muribaculaceae bacterium]
MKKNLLYMAALICCTLALTACGSDDEPSVTTTGTYTLTFGPNIHDAASIIIYYRGDNGTPRFEALQAGTFTWTKTVAQSDYPADFGVKLVVSPKATSELTFDSYNIAIHAEIATTTDGKSNHKNMTDIIDASNVNRDQVEAKLRSANGTVYGYRVDRNGNSTSYDRMSFDL